VSFQPGLSIVVGDEITGLRVWAAGGSLRLIAVGEGANPYLPDPPTGQETTTTTMALPEPPTVHEVMIWSLTGSDRPGEWKVKDTLNLRLTSTFLSTHETYPDCFDDSGRIRIFAFIDPSEWVIEVTDDGDFIGADDLQPVLALTTGAGFQIELLDPLLTFCRQLY
jgi:hypothetical protein